MKNNAVSESRYALQLKAVGKRIDSHHILRGVDLQLLQGETMLLIGPNGAGKSTLFNVISGQLTADCGQILLYGQNMQGLPPEQIYRHGLSRSFQISQLFAGLSVLENMQLACLWQSGCRYAFWRGLGKWRSATTQAYAMLEQVNLLAVAQHKAGQLSYAQQRQLELGICLAGDSSVILLDEPTAGMSRAETSSMIAMIRELCRNKTLLMIEHDMNVVFDMADRIAVLVYGEVLACDTPANIRQNLEVQRAYLGNAAKLPGGAQA